MKEKWPRVRKSWDSWDIVNGVEEGKRSEDHGCMWTDTWRGLDDHHITYSYESEYPPHSEEALNTGRQKHPSLIIVNYKLVLAMVACHLSLQGVNYELLSKLQLLTFNTL